MSVPALTVPLPHNNQNTPPPIRCNPALPKSAFPSRDTSNPPVPPPCSEFAAPPHVKAPLSPSPVSSPNPAARPSPPSLPHQHPPHHTPPLDQSVPTSPDFSPQSALSNAPQ